ncbi:intradiol ring-cleavage dioxygenase [Streptomyces sp. NPDC044780]|uniref:Intradiol ring-cleavage dioxygenase n=1 Tax=Streptomyces luomodiensis TaxID=3026192 RepID=A0ABY9V0W4_9ACTN|nr:MULTISPECIES: intradiol ring-cleavage dioxygenase [unclassified Streptomyces]WAP55820.1 intradiol ring-cleavage dioxygenase [Streptomyces sp. S465]WNE96355.1 intradiol ring-cleavage dioxygenase [Streptomyces sp. SCA4-21]
MLMTDLSSAPIGRRRVLVAGSAAAAAIGIAGATTAAARPEAASTADTATTAAGTVDAAAICTLTKELTEGPYYLDHALVRSNVTEDKAGVPLQLALTVVDTATCAPLNKALAEIWYCDALGEYSGFVGNNGHQEPDNGRFLRGGVLTGTDGVANLTGIYPGWYRGRCVHIHLKVHTGVTLTSDGSFTGGNEIHTGQLFFDEKITEAVAKVSPYSTNTVPRTPLSSDGIYGNGGTAAGLLAVTALGSTPSAGYRATLTVGVDPDA